MTGLSAVHVPGHAFISYVREDSERVDRLQEILEGAGVRVWRDTCSLWAGQDWQIEIRRAIAVNGLVFIACFSEHTDARDVSYQNEELVLAAEQMRLRPPGSAWLVPVRFAQCSVPAFDLGAGRTLDSLHRIDLFDGSWEGGSSRLLGAVLRILSEKSQRVDDELGRAVCPAGRPVSEWSWQELGIHRAVGTSGLPVYLPRPHDELIDAVLDPSVTASRLVVLRGDSSTGKSRALYRAVAAGRYASWRLARPSLAYGLRELLDSPALAPETIVWLGEIRDYVGQSDTPAAIARLAGILAGRSGLIVVTTIWHDDWHMYGADGYGGPRPYPALHDLLTRLPELDQLGQADPPRGAVIDVPPYFTERDLELAGRTGDPALTTAIRAAEEGGHGGQVVQYLAGVPRLRTHYRQAQYRASGYGKAVLTAAIDAARLADARETSASFLEHAAWGYLSDEQRADAPTDWFRTAMADAAMRLRGGLRALTPLQAADQREDRRYRLADILDQDGRRERAEIIPPPSFFAAARHASPVTARRLGDAAAARGLLRTAAVLYRVAAPHDVKAAECLVLVMHGIDPADPRPAVWCWFSIVPNQGYIEGELSSLLVIAKAADQLAMLADRIHPSKTHAVALLVSRLREARAWPLMIALADRALACIDLSDYRAVASLLRDLRNTEPGRRLAERIAAHDNLASPYGLVSALQSAGADQQAAILAGRIAAEADVINPMGVGPLIYQLADCGFGMQLDDLAGRAAAQADLGNRQGVKDLMRALWKVGAWSSRDALADRLIAYTDLGNPVTAAWLLDILEAAGSTKKNAVADRVVALADVGDPEAAAALIKVLRKPGYVKEPGSERRSSALAARAVAQADPGDLKAVGILLQALEHDDDWFYRAALADRAIARTDRDGLQVLARLLRQIPAGRHQQFQLSTQSASAVNDAATHADMSDPIGVAALIEAMGRLGMEFGNEPAALVGRLVTQADVTNPRAAATLIEALRHAGFDTQSATLAERAAKHADLGNPDAVAHLVRELRYVNRYGKTESPMTALLNRNPAARVELSSAGAANLIKQLRWANANSQVVALADRAAAQVELRPELLLEIMRECGDPRTLLASLADRIAAHADTSSPYGVSSLSRELQKVGFCTQADKLISRLPAAGHFDSFTQHSPYKERFRFGREADGSPAANWGWNDVGPETDSTGG